MPALRGSFRGGAQDAGADYRPPHPRDCGATSLQTLVADLLAGGAVAGFAAGVLDSQGCSVLAAGLVLVIDEGIRCCHGGGAVAEIEDVLDDRVAKLRIGRRGV